MYSVSNAFLEQMKSPIQEHKITGTIGSVSFDEANIVEGSFSISNQSTDTNDVVLGSCYVGQLTVEFVGINIAYGKWINKTITPSFGLKVGEYYEYVPLGVYKVKEAKHTDHGVQVTAYDNMIKFDKKFSKSHYMNLSGMTNIIDQLCLDAGVVCGMSHAQIEALPNGDRTGINIYGSTGKKAEFANDITTLRDLLFWVAQTLGCFATINRAGQLEFRQYTQDVVDNISNVHRIEGATFADYITHYVGIYVENLDDNTEDYYGYDTTALTQELQETMSEITEDQEDITDLELDRADWVQKLANHECTQQEYDAAIAEIDEQEKALTKEINQLSKRAGWLSNAIAQSADDGSDMVLGANPLVMAKNLTTRDAQRREILGALNAISYTPFQASVVCGCIYDLGDVIQFSGGLYNSDTDSFGCVMSYTYTHNGGTELEGFGVDPSVVVIRNKTQKSTDRAQRDAINAKEISSGNTTPVDTDGKENDVYFKKGTSVTRTPKYTVSYSGKYAGMVDTRYPTSYPWSDSLFQPREIHWSDDGYYILCTGLTEWYAYDVGSNFPWVFGTPALEVNISEPGTYKWHCKVRYNIIGDHPEWGLGICINTPPENGGYPDEKGTQAGNISSDGLVLNVEDGSGLYEYSAQCNITQSLINDGHISVFVMRQRGMPTGSSTQCSVRIELLEFYFEKVDSQGHEEGYYTETTEPYVDGIYVKEENDNGTERWQEVDYVHKVDDSENSGLSYERPTQTAQKVLKLTPNVMRAWYKADPPQIERNFSQFCVRYTGAPDGDIAIAPYNGNEWSNVSCKQAEDGSFALKCGGTKTTGTVAYYAYQITGLTVGQQYYFNFAADFGTNADIGGNTNKSFGVVFNTTGIISSDDYSGEPHTFDDETLYESFYRNNRKHYYDFDFAATATTMYMCVVLGDLNACTTQLSIKELVISKTERKYIRKFYLYDTTEKAWLEYRPFGAGDDGGAITIDTLSGLTDVSISNLANGQILKWNSTTHKWENSADAGGASSLDELDDVIISSPTSGQVLKYDGKKWVNDTDAGGSQAIEITKAAYDALPSADKNDPNKVYYVKDYPTPSGIDLDDIDDVDITTPTDGQVLKYDAVNSKWVNGADEGDDLFTVVNGMVCITYET